MLMEGRAGGPVLEILQLEQGQIPGRSATRQHDRDVIKGASFLSHWRCFGAPLKLYPTHRKLPASTTTSRANSTNTTRSRPTSKRWKRSNRAPRSLLSLHHLELIGSFSGNLASKSLAAIVPPNLLIRDSEYIETHLIAVPLQLVKDFPKTYETLSTWVVPRSAVKIDADAEFALFAVTTFKKHSADFVHKCREQKWTPRDYSAKEGGQEAERRELEKVRKEERQLWGEVLRLARIDWGEAVMAWVHVLALRVFVETVLRYGLPLSFVAGLVQVSAPLFAQSRWRRGGLIGRCRRRPSWRRRFARTWTSITRILQEMRSGGISGDERSRMTRRMVWCRGKAGMASIRLTSVMISRLARASIEHEGSC